ncbi:MAG: hypothetical protein OXC05_08310 [Halieaceae bacterium]|nr:hypothetical protein [Halieaceae bacterium]
MTLLNLRTALWIRERLPLAKVIALSGKGSRFASDPFSPSIETVEAGADIETVVEAQNAVNSGLTHYGYMQGISRGEAIYRVEDRPGGANLGNTEAQDVVD